MKKLCFLWYWNRAKEIYPYWRDGLRAAIEEIGKNHDVDIYLGETLPKEEYDMYLLWGDVNCSAIPLLNSRKGQKGIILTSDNDIWRAASNDYLKMLDVVFCESSPVYESVRKLGYHAVKAFGTDIDFFTPDTKVEKDIEYFYPATFSPWKKQSELAYLKDKLWLVGTIQPDGKEEYEACKKAGSHIAIGYFKVEYIRDLYRRAKNVIISAIHGSERTVLEAMSCDIEPIITNLENRRTISYINEYHTWSLQNPSYATSRNFVITNYSHTKYAQDILKGFSL